MNIKILCIGKLKEKYWTEASDEYIKRIKRFSNITVSELPEEMCSDNPSSATVKAVKEKEGERLLQKVLPGEYCIVLDLLGKQVKSEGFAKLLADTMLGGKSSIVFIIGGSFGLSEAVAARADYVMSMSELTFPHQMARVIILEQLYRAMKINANEKYHK